MRLLKKITTFILTLIVTISTLAYIIINLINNSIMKETYILSKLNENDYYTKTYNLLELNFENYIQQSGLEEDVIKNITTEEQIRQDTQIILANMYDGTNEEISTEQIKNKLNKNIKESLGSRTLSQAENTAIEQFINVICEEYQKTILHTEYEKTIYNLYYKANKYINLAEKIMLLTTGISIILIIIIRSRKIYKAISYIGAALLSIGTLLLTISFWIKIKINLAGISILNEAFSDVVKNILQENANKLTESGIAFAIIGLMVIIISNIIHNVKKYKGQKRKEEKWKR